MGAERGKGAKGAGEEQREELKEQERSEESKGGTKRADGRAKRVEEEQREQREEQRMQERCKESKEGSKRAEMSKGSRRGATRAGHRMKVRHRMWESPITCHTFKIADHFLVDCDRGLRV